MHKRLWSFTVCKLQDTPRATEFKYLPQQIRPEGQSKWLCRRRLHIHSSPHPFGQNLAHRPRLSGKGENTNILSHTTLAFRAFRFTSIHVSTQRRRRPDNPVTRRHHPSLHGVG